MSASFITPINVKSQSTAQRKKNQGKLICFKVFLKDLDGERAQWHNIMRKKERLRTMRNEQTGFAKQVWHNLR